MDHLHNQSVDRLFAAIAGLQNKEEFYQFFEDVCTIKELQDMAQRLEAAVLLAKGENYQAISQQVGISTATISRVSRCLNYGSGGYRLVIDRMSEEEQA